MNKINVPSDYDYLGVYLTDKCHLACPYCITRHHESNFGHHQTDSLEPSQWVEGLNRFQLPQDVPVTLQGGEPFLYRGLSTILENVHHKIDILTALPPFVDRSFFENLNTLSWNQRVAPYPTIRVSYHRGQHDFHEMVDRIALLQGIVRIGLYYLEHPTYEKSEITAMQRYAKEKGIEFRSKEFLGYHNDKQYGDFLYPDAAIGVKKGVTVKCKNTVIPIGKDGTVYRCHSDLYFNRTGLSLGNILDNDFQIPEKHLVCTNYGLCNECDVKIKTNHYQVFGYTSVDIQFENKEK